mgnify:CR=1 FL=1
MAARRSPIARSVAGAPDTYDWANPTKNVEALVEASVKSLSNEAVLRAQLADSNIAHQKEIGQLRERVPRGRSASCAEDHQARMSGRRSGSVSTRSDRSIARRSPRRPSRRTRRSRRWRSKRLTSRPPCRAESMRPRARPKPEALRSTTTSRSDCRRSNCHCLKAKANRASPILRWTS